MELRAKRIEQGSRDIPKSTELSAKVLHQLKTEESGTSLNVGCCITAVTGCNLCDKVKERAGLLVGEPLDVKGESAERLIVCSVGS